MNNILVGYARKASDGVKVSINVQALNDCKKYTTSNNQEYVALVINRLALEKVLNGERAVTTIFQLTE